MTLLEMLGSTNLRRSTPEDYRILREIVKSFERYSGVGNDIQLTLPERSANELIMSEKKREYEKGIMDPSKFAPGHHIFQVLHTVKQSPLFQILRKMPKGAALKTHDTSMCSSRAVIEMTYRENLWVCTTHKGCRVVEFRFAKEKPKDVRHEDGEWQPMEKLRELRGEENLRKYLRVRLSMYPLASFTTNALAWRQIEKSDHIRAAEGRVPYNSCLGQLKNACWNFSSVNCSSFLQQTEPRWKNWAS